MKYCEICGAPFSRDFVPTVPRFVEELEHVRVTGSGTHYRREFAKIQKELRRDVGKRLCRECTTQPAPWLRAEQLQEKQLSYKDQLPNLDIIHASSHPVKYDRSLSPMGRDTSAHRASQRPQRRKVPTGYYKQRKREALEALENSFRERGRLSVEDMQGLIPGCFTLNSVICTIRNWQLPLKRVSWYRREGIKKGLGMGVYVWDGVSPETIQ